MRDSQVEARAITPGKCFLKRKGEYVYVRISESAVKFLGLDGSKVYGVCYNGNVTVIKPDALVTPLEIKDMLANVNAEKKWEKMIGIKK